MSKAEARDRSMMREALRVARRGNGETFPNPSVGAVIFRGDQILSRGRTRPPGGAHAEIDAIKKATRRHGERALRGASIAVTLEPCSFTGRTGPCTKALIESGLTRVVAGARDPHPKVSGRGFTQLRRAGLEVEAGVLEEDCRRQHRGFFSVCTKHRPFVTLKLATSLDGRIALGNGASRWITSEKARAFVHVLRREHDGVLVGSKTAIADDPELNVRRGAQIVRRPIRILVDGGLRVPVDRKLFRPAGDSRTWVMCREGARGRRKRAEVAERILEIRENGGGHIDLQRALRRLAEEGLTSVFVEGGGELAAAMLRADLIDEVHWMLAPKMIGSDGKPGLGPLGLTQLADAAQWEVVSTQMRGPDLHFHAAIRRTTSKTKPKAKPQTRAQKKGTKP